MLNQIVLVGRLTRDITVNKAENGVKVATISIAVPRSFKNVEGVYDTDFVNIKTFDSIAQNTAEYCNKGDIVGVKGRIQTGSYEKDGEKKFSMDIIAEKVTFLSSRSNENKNKDDVERD